MPHGCRQPRPAVHASGVRGAAAAAVGALLLAQEAAEQADWAAVAAGHVQGGANIRDHWSKTLDSSETCFGWPFLVYTAV